MTISNATARCDWCGAEFTTPRGPGRPAQYCRRSHRQRAYEARRLATERGIAPHEVLISKATWDHFRDALYGLEAASEDVAMDLMGGRATKADYVAALVHLSSAIDDLQNVAVEPIAVAAV